MSINSRKYRVSPKAENDLEEIWLYTLERWSLNQADKYHREIVETFEQLANGTKRGRETLIRKGYYKYRSGSHFVYFRYADTELQIIRILHKSREPSLHL